ncbi:hypothetical protein D3C85_911200 [compost metagenome]
MFPPNGAGDSNPGIAVKEARTYVLARSCNSLLERMGLLNTNCPTGREEASNLMIKGGWEPGGKIACALFDKALSSEAACAMFVPS